MSKINFTPEHLARLKELAVKSLFDGETFRVTGIGNEANVGDLIHNTSLNSLTKYHQNLRKEISDIESLDEWSLTDHQRAKASRLRKTQELINLLIGYKRYESEKEAEKEKVKKLQETYAKLKEDTKTPEVRMKELEAEILAAGGTL